MASLPMIVAICLLTAGTHAARVDERNGNNQECRNATERFAPSLKYWPSLESRLHALQVRLLCVAFSRVLDRCCRIQLGRYRFAPYGIGVGVKSH